MSLRSSKFTNTVALLVARKGGLPPVNIRRDHIDLTSTVPVSTENAKEENPFKARTKLVRLQVKCQFTFSEKSDMKNVSMITKQ